MNFGLSDKTIAEIKKIFAKFPLVEKVIIYGSRAKGNFRSGSDIDLTLFGEGLNSDILLQINREFDESFLPYKFDLSIFAQLENQDFIDHIKRVGIIFYTKK